MILSTPLTAWLAFALCALFITVAGGRGNDSGVAIVGLLFRPCERLLQIMGWTILMIFSLYPLNNLLPYLHGE